MHTSTKESSKLTQAISGTPCKDALEVLTNNSKSMNMFKYTPQPPLTTTPKFKPSFCLGPLKSENHFKLVKMCTEDKENTNSSNMSVMT